MIPVVILLFVLLGVSIIPVSADERWAQPPGFGPSYVSDTVPDRMFPGSSQPVFITFKNTGLVTWKDDMRRIGLLYEGDNTKIVALPSFVEISPDLNITPGREATFALTLLAVGTPGTYELPFSVVMRSAVTDQKITETYRIRVTIVPTDGISSPVNGSVFVDSGLIDLEVFLDARAQGNVPAIIPDIKPGMYSVLVRRGTFEQVHQVEVHQGVMTRLFIRDQSSEPVIEFRKVGAVSDGTLIGYIEANIPLILIIFLILGVCGGIIVHGLRKRKRDEERHGEKRNKGEEDSDDPAMVKAKLEKQLLDEIHKKPPLFEGLSSESSMGSGSNTTSPGSTLLYSRRGSFKKVARESEEKQSDKKGAGLGSTSSPRETEPDVTIRLENLETRPGSATAHFGVSNRSEHPVRVEDQEFGAGGFGILPVELSEPADDSPDMVLNLRVFAEGLEYLRNFSVPYNRGIALLARGALEKAYEYFTNLLHREPGRIDAMLEQALILYGWGLIDEAEALLEEVLQKDPGNTDASEALGHIKQVKQEKIKKREETKRPDVPGYPDELSERYTPIRVLGEDPFATIILVRRNDTGDLRALKIPKIMEQISPTLYTEISLLYQLRHPYVLRMFRAEFQPVMFLELEYVSGGHINSASYMNLSKLPVPLPEEVWVPLIAKIAEGLVYLHRQGVRHYHLSPQHILLDEPMEPKISGLIRESLRGAGISGSEEFFVKSPEQIDPFFFGKPGKKTDIYQLGAVWYWLVTGKVIQMADSGDEPVDSSRLLSSFNPEYERYDPLLRNLIAQFKADRYSGAELFLKDLEELAGEAVFDERNEDMADESISG